MGSLFRARAGIAAVFFLNGFGYGSWVPRIAEIQDRLEISEGQLGLALFMAALGALIAMPLAGAAAHRYGSRAATAVALAGFGLSLPGLALAPSLLGLGLALFVAGAAGGALDVSMNAQGVAVEKGYRAPIMSSLHGMFSLGGMTGAGVTGLLAALEVAIVPHFAGICALILAVGAIAYRPLLPAAAEAAAAGPGFARPSLALLLPGIVALAALLSEGAVADWSAVYLSANLDAGTTMAAAAFAAFSLMMAAGRLSGDRLVARLGGDRVVRAGGALAACGLGLTLAIGHPVVAVIGFGLVGAGISCVFPVVLSSAARATDLPPSAAIAAVCTVGYFGFLLGPPMIGGLAELIGLPAALGLVVLLCALIAALGSRTPAPRAPAPAGSSG
ncbi:MAG TPA: MFS transporter [Geminicoccaceae bacterium]|nr:MFS transporter [Geminicoccaceae bacterium]